MHVFPNGAITTLSNLTQGFSHYVFDVGVAYKEDPDRVMDLLRGIGAKIIAEPEWEDRILQPLEVLGVDRFDESAVVIKMRIQTVPGKQWTVGREINRRIKRTFDEAGVEIPFPHRTVYFGAAPPVDVRLAGPDRNELRRVIREECAALAGGDAATGATGPGDDPGA